MTVHKPKDRATFRYKFVVDGKVYQGNTQQITKADAEEVEEREKRRVRRQLAGLPILSEHSPRFTDWAQTYVTYLRQRGKVRRIDRVEDLLRVVLRFFGAKPSGRNPKHLPIEGEPYHNLRLADPIRDADWIEKFEEWIRRRRIYVGKDEHGDPVHRPVSAQTRLHYLSVVSRLYRVAALPRFRKRTGILPHLNPLLGVERDKPPSRKVIITPAELRRWLAHTPRHAQLAIAIAALAPKLRKENVLRLRWDRSFDPQLQYITVEEHKTVGKTKLPLVVPIGRTLRRLLKALQPRADSAWVITYRGKPVQEIRRAIKQGAEAAGLTYGRDVDGVTFHTIRHMAATLLAEVPGLTEAQRSATMGQDILTTQAYTHLRPASQRPVVDHLATKLNLDRVLEEAFGRPESESGPTPRGAAKKRSVKPSISKKRQIARKPRSRQQPQEGT